MPSRFPGMDPYLESPRYWSDFHHRFIDVLSEAINDRLPESYFATIDEHVIIVDPELPEPRLTKPDLLVTRNPLIAGERSVAVAEPEIGPEVMFNVVQLDPLRLGFIEIRRMADRELVTVVEVLSPANKNGDRGQYLKKRELLLRREVSVVELDLLRAGRRLQLDRPLPPADYYAFVSRSERRPECEVYHWKVRRRLPSLPIPLRPGEAQIHVDLQQVFAVTFDRGKYGRRIDYSQPPPLPPFEGEDSEWVLQTARSTSSSTPD